MWFVLEQVKIPLLKFLNGLCSLVYNIYIPYKLIQNIKKLNDYDNLPETAKKLINQGLEDINEGRVHTHEDVMAEFRKKYNLV